MRPVVCVVTGSRAEYGLLRPLVLAMLREPSWEVRLVATGSHLCGAFGHTVDEIVRDGVPVHRRIPVLTGREDAKAGMAATTGLAMGRFADYFAECRPDLLVVLGDRYEIFAAATAAAMLNIPIAHLYGGETTEGAVDEFLRHAVTKMSFLHFTACEAYRRRVIQLGEAPNRVFDVGSLGIENALRVPPLPHEALQASLGFPLPRPYAVVTFHPVTQERGTGGAQTAELVRAMEAFPDMAFLITKANADAGGGAINALWEEAAARHPGWHLVASLGMRRYLSALRYAEMMLGNSSSGVTEAPALHIPTVNIGDRQRGRIMAESVIACEPVAEAVVEAMRRARGPAMKAVAAKAECPFGDGTASARIVKVLRDFLSAGTPDLKKSFYDIPVEGEQ